MEHQPVPLIVWIGFIGGVAALITADLLILHRRPAAVPMRQALQMTAFWVLLAAALCVAIGFWRGQDSAMLFATAYIVEESLSVDNVFVFAVIFARFGVPPQYQPRVLFWGIIGAVVMRGAFIAGGLALVSMFAWTMYIFGAILIWAGVKLVLVHASDAQTFDPSTSRLVRVLQKFLPLSSTGDGGRFTIRQSGRLRLTPLFLVLCVIEVSDLLFAVDSIPAVIGITRDPFIVFSSNIMAILGLRALYFVVSNLLEKFHLLHYGLGLIIVFIGVKLILGALPIASTEVGEHGIHISSMITLSVIVLVLTGFSLASLAIRPTRKISEIIRSAADE
ncbi:MAG: TerC family protein [Phycisphaerales bacterium]|nr:TerC family protein [Phycisphaerales bacterium]